jgi:tellurite resistance protein TerC
MQVNPVPRIAVMRSCKTFAGEPWFDHGALKAKAISALGFLCALEKHGAFGTHARTCAACTKNVAKEFSFMETIGTWWMWTGFAVFVLIAIAVDLLVMEKQGAHKVTTKEALTWSVIWFSLAFVFVALLWWYLDGSQGRATANEVSMQFITGYLVEKSLSVDNIFVFLMIFTYFAIPAEFQKRALIIGIIGAIVLRAILILVGAWLLAQFHWILYVFGAFLVLTGAKMWFAAGKEPDIETNPALKVLRKYMKITTEFNGEKMTKMIGGVKHFTPIFVVLILIGVTDIIFAVDSIPAIFAITSDPFIVLTANIFAILGLRALYFLLADLADRFHLLAYGLALVLIFIGIKMLLLDVYKIPIGIALGVTASLIAISMFASLWATRKKTT